MRPPEKPATETPRLSAPKLFEGTQVRCILQIQEDVRYDEVNTVPEESFTEQFQVVAEPYQKDNGSWWIDIRYTRPQNRDVHTIYSLSLRDQHLFPYEDDGSWNRSNYIRISADFGETLAEVGTNCPCKPYHE